MPKFTMPLVLTAAAVLSVGFGVALGLNSATSDTPSTAGAVQPQPSSGPTAQDAAVAAVRAHLRRGNTEPDLIDIKVLPLDGAGEYVVCAKLKGQAGDIVARILPGSGTWYDAETRQTRHVSRGIVVLEDGPGLWRGGGMGVARQRYCGGQRPGTAADAPASATEAAAILVQPIAAPPPSDDREGGMVTVTSPVRVRSSPSGDSDVLFVAERGREFTVHGHAPGGWVEIGDSNSASGWAHSSLLTMNP